MTPSFMDPSVRPTVRLSVGGRPLVLCRHRAGGRPCVVGRLRVGGLFAGREALC
jgi:hypothetical protein